MNGVDHKGIRRERFIDFVYMRINLVNSGRDAVTV